VRAGLQRLSLEGLGDDGAGFRLHAYREDGLPTDLLGNLLKLASSWKDCGTRQEGP
jgi:hypothetical protein